MATFDIQVNMLLVLGECHKNYRRAAAVFFERYQIRKSPTTFFNVEKSLRENGTFAKRTRNKTKPVVNEANTINICAAIALNPHISQRVLARTSGVSRSSIQRIMNNQKYHPYHIVLTQELLRRDFERRITFCNWLRNNVAENNFLERILFSDESTFQNSGHVNRHNMHYWAVENPNWMRAVPFQHRWSLNVWCGIIGNYVIGRYFFEGTVKSQNYYNFLKYDLPVLLEEVPLNVRRDMWFQQDGAPPHFANLVKRYLNKKFRNKWIGRDGPVNWPPRSPDLSPLDFFLWGYVKDKVMLHPPTTREDMKERIRDACATVTPEMLTNVRNNVLIRAQKCLEVNGGH